MYEAAFTQTSLFVCAISGKVVSLVLFIGVYNKSKNNNDNNFCFIIQFPVLYFYNHHSFLIGCPSVTSHLKSSNILSRAALFMSLKGPHI